MPDSNHQYLGEIVRGESSAIATLSSGRRVNVGAALGRSLRHGDLGKRVYRMNGKLEVETDRQLDARMNAGTEGPLREQLEHVTAERDRLEEAVEALNDQLVDQSGLLSLLAEELGVGPEPHQTFNERLVEYARKLGSLKSVMPHDVAEKLKAMGYRIGELARNEFSAGDAPDLVPIVSDLVLVLSRELEEARHRLFEAPGDAEESGPSLSSADADAVVRSNMDLIRALNSAADGGSKIRHSIDPVPFRSGMLQDDEPEDDGLESITIRVPRAQADAIRRGEVNSISSGYRVEEPADRASSPPDSSIPIGVDVGKPGADRTARVDVDFRGGLAYRVPQFLSDVWDGIDRSRESSAGSHSFCDVLEEVSMLGRILADGNDPEDYEAAVYRHAVRVAAAAARMADEGETFFADYMGTFLSGDDEGPK